MASLLLKSGSRLIRPTAAEVPRVLATSGFHTSSASAGTWAIPERLQHIPDSEDPNFFNMVEYYFHKACILAEDNLVGNSNVFISYGVPLTVLL
jgi:hypothetical protein